jgi:hypothetical protein
MPSLIYFAGFNGSGKWALEIGGANSLVKFNKKFKTG